MRPPRIGRSRDKDQDSPRKRRQAQAAKGKVEGRRGQDQWLFSPGSGTSRSTRDVHRDKHKIDTSDGGGKAVSDVFPLSYRRDVGLDPLTDIRHQATTTPS